MGAPGYKTRLQAKRVLDFQKRTIDQLQAQLEDLCAEIERDDRSTTDQPTAPLDPAEALAQIDALEEQLFQYGKELGTLYTLTRDKERQIRAAQHQAISVLIQISELKYPFLVGHSERIAGVSLAIARQLDLKDAEREEIRLGGLLHDIGTLAIDATVLGQNRVLRPDEMEQVRQHPELGARIVSGISSLKSVAPIIRYHHERFDGRGYPRGLTGSTIPLGAKIVAVAEVFDSLASPRPHRPALPIGLAVDQVRRLSGTQLDVRAVLAFVAAFKAGELAEHYG